MQSITLFRRFESFNKLKRFSEHFLKHFCYFLTNNYILKICNKKMKQKKSINYQLQASQDKRIILF